MKKEYYVIEGVINGGYWDENTSSFRGFLFASQYASEDCKEILKAISIACKNPCKITKIYYSV